MNIHISSIDVPEELALGTSFTAKRSINIQLEYVSLSNSCLRDRSNLYSMQYMASLQLIGYHVL